ncbi:hypothetical protein [Ferroplasma sp.]|uniref:hypothetical protein n=1 Tax=Ferroplasma sp. TaxID=2591003 RepID=UPI0017B824BE|nr:hypothetical protein [Ferroplasma sp.]HII81941.1 hypothetical protein [Ferroplasma sp.]
MSKVVSIRLSDNEFNIMNKLIFFKIVKNKTDAINYILEHGVNNAKDIIKRKETAQELLEKYLNEGLPELPSNLSDISIMERE